MIRSAVSYIGARLPRNDDQYCGLPFANPRCEYLQRILYIADVAHRTTPLGRTHDHLLVLLCGINLIVAANRPRITGRNLPLGDICIRAPSPCVPYLSHPNWFTASIQLRADSGRAPPPKILPRPPSAPISALDGVPTSYIFGNGMVSESAQMIRRIRWVRFA